MTHFAVVEIKSDTVMSLLKVPYIIIISFTSCFALVFSPAHGCKIVCANQWNEDCVGKQLVA